MTNEKQITELVFLIDCSGSMSGFEQDTVGGFNSMIAKQKKFENETLVSTILFCNHSTVLHDRVNISKIPEMTVSDFQVGGTTALLDTIGSSIKHISNIHKYARTEDKPSQTIFVITTDGYENSSKIYNNQQIKKLVQEKRNQDWEFIFLGADIDAFSIAQTMGMNSNYVHEFNKTKASINESYSKCEEMLCKLRTNKN